MDTTARLLRLLSLLQGRSRWYGHELAERCEVTPRTLRRDVARLRELGYAVEATSGPHGGYRMAAGGALPPLLLSEDEAVTVALGLRAAAEGGLPGLEDTAVAALAKIEHVLPARVQARVEAVGDATVRLPSGRPALARIDVATLVVIARACRGSERLRFTYRDAGDRVSERHVEPHQVVHVSRRWYLVARDRDREAWRSFRVDRISDPVATGMRFEPVDPPDPVRFVTEGIAVGAYSYRARIALHVSPAQAARLVSPTIGVLEPAGAHAVLVIGADEMEWIAGYLAGLPCRFTVIEPPELVQAVRNLAKRLSDDASRTPAGGGGP